MDEHPTDSVDGVVHMHRLSLTDDGYQYTLYRQSTVKQLEADGCRTAP